MPFTGPGDPSIPQRIRAFWKNIRATTVDKRQWVDVFNSCFKKPPEGTASAQKDGVCIQVASGVMGRTIRRRRGMSTIREDPEDAGIPFEVVK